MKTLSYSRRWQYAIFRGFIRTAKSLLYSLVKSVAVTLDNLSQSPYPIVAGTITSLEQIAKQTGVILIRGYQKYLSPYKGFSCAHRLVYGGESCSQYVKNMLIEQDLQSAISLSRKRFSACKTAKIILRAETIEEKRRRQKNNTQSNCSCSPESCLPDCDCGDCGGDLDCGDCDC